MKMPRPNSAEASLTWWPDGIDTQAVGGLSSPPGRGRGSLSRPCDRCSASRANATRGGISPTGTLWAQGAPATVAPWWRTSVTEREVFLFLVGGKPIMKMARSCPAPPRQVTSHYLRKRPTSANWWAVFVMPLLSRPLSPCRRSRRRPTPHPVGPVRPPRQAALSSAPSCWRSDTTL